MKLTEAKRKWVLNKVEHYCSLLKCPVPKIYLTMADYNRWKDTFRAKPGEHIGRTNVLGVCHGNIRSMRTDEFNFIVILVKRHKDTKQLDDTIRHELIHWAKPSYNHCSKEFFDRMEKLKKGKLNANGRFTK